MYQQPNGSLRHGVAALLAAFSTLVAGCPGPAPHAGAGGAGGESTSVSASSGITSCGPFDVCFPPLPQGWEGPFAVYTGGNPAAAAECPVGMTGVWHGGVAPIFPNAGCPMCMCMPPTTGPGCGAPVASLTNDPTCGGTPCAPPLTLTTGCQTLKGPNETICGTSATVGLNIAITAPITGGGVCQGVPLAKPSLPPASWGTSYVGCTLTGGTKTCNGETCVEAPTQGTPAKLCINSASMNSCPAGPFSVMMPVYTAFNEGRSCTPCSCGTLTWTCPTKATVSNMQGCGNGVTYDVPDSCGMVNFPESDTYYAELQMQAMVTNPSCQPILGKPMGGVTGGNPLTVCCMP